MQNVKHLVRRGLFNAGLVQLTPTLITRYNECLVSMGIEPTTSKEVFVDGAGWSPQVARERKNPYYLHNSLANPNAIIVTPEQYKKPVFFWPYSWMRGALRVVFERNHRAIFDVNATTWITVEFDNGLSTLEGPPDLLLLTSISAKLNNDGLSEKAEAQNALVSEFSEGLKCLDEGIRNRLRASAAAIGDMRNRKLDLQPIVFDTFNDFYTVAFDGAAVLRHVEGRDLLILENHKVFESVKTDHVEGAEICFLHDPENKAFRLLQKAGMIEIPIDEFRENPSLLEDKRQLLLGQSLCDAEEGLDWDQCSTSKRKTLMSKHADKVPQLFGELERFSAALKRSANVTDVSEELFMFLAKPADLPPTTQEVLMILLTRREPRRLLELYDYDKNKFIALNGEWTDAKQKWVADYIAARYVPRGKRS